MKENFEKSLRMIKILHINNKKEYNQLHKKFLTVTADSLMYITGKRNFKEVVKLAKKQKIAIAYLLHTFETTKNLQC